MATSLNLLPFPATAARPSAATRHLKTGRKTATSCAASSGSKWWTPLFGWSPEPDYIDSENQSEQDETAAAAKAAKTRFAPGCFTAEKAKQLRIMTKDSETFHDAMYHSAIASRLALDSDD